MTVVHWRTFHIQPHNLAINQSPLTPNNQNLRNNSKNNKTPSARREAAGSCSDRKQNVGPGNHVRDVYQSDSKNRSHEEKEH